MPMPSNHAAILVYLLMPGVEIMTSEGVTVTRNRLECLRRAVADDYELIEICFSTRDIAERGGVIDLCSCLHDDPRSQRALLLASMDGDHRDLTIRMKQAGVGFVEMHRGKSSFVPEAMARAVRQGGGALCIDRVLARLCPFLAYAPIDDRSELITCRACRNRMVLGGRRLHDVCEREDHTYCEYFMNPRTRS